jgi:hypothetical protein
LPLLTWEEEWCGFPGRKAMARTMAATATAKGLYLDRPRSMSPSVTSLRDR